MYMQKRKPRYRMPQMQSINSQARYKRRSQVNQSDLALCFPWNVGGCQRAGGGGGEETRSGTEKRC